MKKIFSFIAFVLIAFAAQAEEDVVLLPTKAQVGTTAKVGVVVKHDAAKGPAAGIIFFYSIPDGTTLSGITALGGGSGDYNPVNCKASYDGYEALTTANPDGAVICTLDIEIPESMALGEYPVALTDIQVVYEDGITDFTIDRTESTITVQKAAVIESLGEGYSIDIVPAKMEAGYFADGKGTTLDIYYTAAKDIVNMSFDIKLQDNNMYSTTDPVVAPVINNLIVTGTPSKSITIKATGDQSLNVSFEGVKSSRSSKSYINAAETPTKLATITIESEEILADGIYSILIDNISLEEFNGGSDGNVRQGNNYSTLVVGTPTQNEAIIYGYCTSSAASAISPALKNVAIVDVTAATVAEDAKFIDVLVNENGGHSYYTRTAANFATTVLPLDLTTENVDELYMIESMDADGIVLTEAASVSANTPCIFKGTINVEGATPPLGVPSEQGLGQTTYKGTYEATSIDAGAGYYISGGAFYGDGAAISPFRGYFDGAIAGVKSFSIKLNTADGLIDITDQLSDEAIYSLQGIRVQNAQKGINIKGGKKVYVK